LGIASRLLRYYYLRKRFIAIAHREWDFDFAEYLDEKLGKVRQQDD
jgi:hypothetical protein